MTIVPDNKDADNTGCKKQLEDASYVLSEYRNSK